MARRAEAPTVPVTGGFAERARVAFFRSFFRLFLVFIALAEWACIAWVVRALGGALPAAVHVVAPAFFYLLNNRIILRRSVRESRLVDAAIRAYASMAFTCVFCALVLILATI